MEDVGREDRKQRRREGRVKVRVLERRRWGGVREWRIWQVEGREEPSGGIECGE